MDRIALTVRLSLTLIILVWGAMAAQARESVDLIETRLTLAEDGVLTARHRIGVTADGDEIQRGIFFELPRRLGALQIVSVTRDGAPEPYARVGDNNRTLRIGERDVLLTPGPYTYDIVYRAARPFWLREDGRIRIAWTPIAGQFDLPWRTARLIIEWPRGAAPDGVNAERYERVWRGPIGTDADGTVGFDGGETILLTWPADAFPESSVRVPSVNAILRFAVPFGLLIIWAYFHLNWQAVGRDPKPGPVSPSYRIPEGLSPAAVRYVQRMGFDMHAFLAALVSLVTKRAVTVERTDDALEVTKQTPRDRLSPGEQAIYDKLFEKEEHVSIGQGGSMRLASAAMALAKALKREYQAKYITRNMGTWVRGGILVAALLAIGVFQFVAEAQINPRDKVGMGIGLISMLIAPFIGLVYFELMKAPTRAGRVVRDEIEALRLYLSSEETLFASQATAQHFLSLLPYAIALDEEEAWEARFGAALDEERDTDARMLLDWYAEMKKNEDDTATTVAVLLPMLSSSGATGANAGGFSGGAGAGGGGAAAGGW